MPTHATNRAPSCAIRRPPPRPETTRLPPPPFPPPLAASGWAIAKHPRHRSTARARIQTTSRRPHGRVRPSVPAATHVPIHGNTSPPPASPTTTDSRRAPSRFQAATPRGRTARWTQARWTLARWTLARWTLARGRSLRRTKLGPAAVRLPALRCESPRRTPPNLPRRTPST